MTTESFRLLQKHQSLAEKLRLEMLRRWLSNGPITQLKKMKLAAKDALMAVNSERNSSTSNR